MKRETLKSIMAFLLKTLAKVEFEGLEHIPPTGGVIIATNHLSRVDIPVLFITPTRPDITALVADKYKDYPFFGSSSKPPAASGLTARRQILPPCELRWMF
jgi:1-acyl-sn-glycerol-3-phosphate acyltransferase